MSDKNERPELTLDKSSEQGFCKAFQDLPEKPSSTIRIFSRSNGDWYSVHGEDALYVAQNIYKTSSVLKYLGGDLPSCTLSQANAKALLRDILLVKLYRAEIWEPEARKNNSWVLGKRASPGNLQAVEEMLFRDSDVAASPVVLAVKVAMKGDQKLVGVAYTDATTMKTLGVSEFVDNDTFSNFESLLIQLGVKECVIPDDTQSYELKKLNAILERCRIVVTERKKGEFQIRDIEQDLTRLMDLGEVKASSLPELELKVAMSSLACLIKYLALMNDESNFGQYSLTRFDLSHYMKLDASAVKALNLMPGPQDGSNKSMSLYGLLNKCKTAPGCRLMAQWLKQPLMNLADIETRHNILEAIFEDTQLRQTLQFGMPTELYNQDEHLKSFPDLHRLGKKFQRGGAKLEDVVRLYQAIIALPGLRDTLKAYDGEHRELIGEFYVEKLEEYMTQTEPFQQLVETTIDLENYDDHEVRIRAEFDSGLQDVRDKMDEIRGQFEPIAQKVADKLNFELGKKLKFEHDKQYGHYLRVTRNDSSALRGKSEYKELVTKKDGVLFTTNKLKDLSDQYAELSERYQRMQQGVTKDIVDTTASYFPVLELLNALVAHLDVMVSFAHASLHAPTPFVRPKLFAKGKGDMKLEASRHPCLEMQDVAIIDNDVEMLRDKSVFHIITGPNMGGKSTYIRQIGMIALMAQIGCFVPCRKASLPIFDSILARVGAGDSQLRGVSTFMAEMLETGSILKAATKDSLIIIDELGRGTSTYDGFGLAWAISEHIATKIGCFALFATHFHELTALAEQIDSVKNLHVEARADERAITLLYKVKEGVSDQSFGIHVAELAKFPEPVIKLAKRKAAELEDPGEGIDQRPWKSSKEEIEEGSTVIEEFLLDFAGVQGLAEMSDEKAAEVLDGVMEKYRGRIESSRFVDEIMNEM
ncbi:MutS-like protein [Rhizophlyctis rosea]|uniref:DNA mismatch repair protein MSH2 n=1 Tax=Rhizophlyctis rosea TaxID=64517 RepID=A0AAD5S9F2_9FUNG|nr:MutS-like protein [Rhizophlyctis rosea]